MTSTQQLLTELIWSAERLRDADPADPVLMFALRTVTSARDLLQIELEKSNKEDTHLLAEKRKK